MLTPHIDDKKRKEQLEHKRKNPQSWGVCNQDGSAPGQAQKAAAQDNNAKKEDK